MKSLDFATLRFETHMQPYMDQGNISGDRERDRYWYEIAQEMHFLSVADPLRDLQLEILAIQQTTSNEQAKSQLLYGGVRRSRFIWDALREFYSIAHPRREAPLKEAESFQLERALNDIYIHSRGLLDNLAWAVLALYRPEIAQDVHPGQVDLFKRKFLKKYDLGWLADIVGPFVAWNTDFKSRRDPIAHRIPLSVPPAIVTPEQQVLRQALYESWWKAGQEVILAMQGRKDSDVVAAKEKKKEELFEELESVGIFYPYMSIDPDSSPVPLYPTVVEDVGNVVEIPWKILKRLSDDWVPG